MFHDGPPFSFENRAAGGSNPEDEVAANLDTKRKSPFAEHPVNKYIYFFLNMYTMRKSVNLSPFMSSFFPITFSLQASFENL